MVVRLLDAGDLISHTCVSIWAGPLFPLKGHVGVQVGQVVQETSPPVRIRG